MLYWNVEAQLFGGQGRHGSVEDWGPVAWEDLLSSAADTRSQVLMSVLSLGIPDAADRGLYSDGGFTLAAGVSHAAQARAVGRGASY